MLIEDPFIDDHIWYIRGYEDNTIRPNNSINRAEVAIVFYRLLKPELKNFTAENAFTDINGDEWYGLAVNLLAHYGILGGYEDDEFRPTQPIARRELAAVVSRFYELTETDKNPFNDIAGETWALKYILSATAKGWFIGDDEGNFRPSDNLTRSEFVTVTNRVLHRHIELEDIPIREVHQFDDFIYTHWAYTAFMEAVYTHEFKRKADNFHEIWLKITDDGLTAPYNH